MGGNVGEQVETRDQHFIIVSGSWEQNQRHLLIGFEDYNFDRLRLFSPSFLLDQIALDGYQLGGLFRGPEDRR